MQRGDPGLSSPLCWPVTTRPHLSEPQFPPLPSESSNAISPFPRLMAACPASLWLPRSWPCCLLPPCQGAALHHTRHPAFARRGADSDLGPATCCRGGRAQTARGFLSRLPSGSQAAFGRPGWGLGEKEAGRERSPQWEGSDLASAGFCVLKCQARAVSSANEETGLQQ